MKALSLFIREFIRPYQTAISALLIIGAVLFAISLNPFGMFSSTVITLKETETIIKEINSLGELITAEYYGEVVESLEGQLSVSTARYTRYDSARRLYQSLKNQYAGLYERYPGRFQKTKRKNILFQDFQDYRKNDVYQLMKATSRKSDKNFLNDVVQKYSWQEFDKLYKAPFQERIQRSLKRNSKKGIKLAYVGRGWVKAGFDLGSLLEEETEIEFDYSPKGDTLYIKNLDPEIFDVDINPWYIFNEKKKVKGYEVLKASKESKISFQDMTHVKLACKEKLRQDALYRDILKKATDSAEETLTGFVNLLHEESEINPVVKIVHTPYFNFKNRLLFDNVIDSLETQEVEALLTSVGSASTPTHLLNELTSEAKSIVDETAWSDVLARAGISDSTSTIKNPY